MNVFITGGTRGIGQGMVREFHSLGHTVVYTGTSQASIEKSGNMNLDNTLGIVCDVRSRTEIVNAFKEALDYLGTIDIVINNAGVNQKHDTIMNLSEEDISHVLDVNVKGMINSTSEALKLMKKQGYGTIYNMEGLGSNNMVFPKTVLYASSKHFLSFFTKGVQKEVKAFDNIRVGTLSPGMVFTDFLKNTPNFNDSNMMRILGRNVDDVAPFLVRKMIRGKRKINYLTFPKIVWRFTTSPFHKTKK